MSTQRKVTKSEILILRISGQKKTMIRRLSAQYGGGMSKVVRRLIKQEADRMNMAQSAEGGFHG